jgi:hypothetical protein
MLEVVGVSLIATVAAFTIAFIWLGSTRRTSARPAVEDEAAISSASVERARLRAEVAELQRQQLIREVEGAEPESSPEERAAESTRSLRRLA